MEYQGKIGITFSAIGNYDIIRSEGLVGGPSYESDSFYTLGVSYIHPLNNWLGFETGLEFSKYTIIVQPHLPPNVNKPSSKADLALLNIPLTLRANFLKYFFINGGLLLYIDISNSGPIDTQTGLGGILGVAAKYDFDFGASVFVNPYLKLHSLVPFSSNDHHQKLAESGIRFGIHIR